jgi:hypothetical protein
MGKQSARLERATDELRQVRHMEWAQDHLLVYYTTQRKWLVAMGETIEVDGCDGSLETDKGYTWFGTRLADDYETSFKVISTYAKAREEWRDLPVVEAEANKGAE